VHCHVACAKIILKHISRKQTNKRKKKITQKKKRDTQHTSLGSWQSPIPANAWIVLALFFKTFAARPVVLVTLRVFFERSQISFTRKDLPLPAAPAKKVLWPAKMRSSTFF